MAVIFQRVEDARKAAHRKEKMAKAFPAVHEAAESALEGWEIANMQYERALTIRRRQLLKLITDKLNAALRLFSMIIVNAFEPIEVRVTHFIRNELVTLDLCNRPAVGDTLLCGLNEAHDRFDKGMFEVERIARYLDLLIFAVVVDHRDLVEYHKQHSFIFF